VAGQPRGPRGRWAVLLRRHRRPITDRSELADVTEATGTPVHADSPATPGTTPEKSGPMGRDEAHIPKAAAPQ